MNLMPWRRSSRVDIRNISMMPFSVDADTTAWESAVVTAGGSVSSGRLTIVNNLIVGLKADGIWSKLDRLWILAAENIPSARADLVARVSLTDTGDLPTFTTDRGYAGHDNAGPTKYLITGFVPNTHGVTFTQNSAHISAWNRTNTSTGGGGCLGGCAGSNMFVTFTDGNLYGRINDSPESGSQGSVADRTGHWVVNRSGSSASQIYRNASIVTSPNQASGALATHGMFILALNNAGSNFAGTPNELAAFSIGGSLNGTEVTNFRSRLQTYMTAVGA